MQQTFLKLEICDLEEKFPLEIFRLNSTEFIVKFDSELVVLKYVVEKKSCEILCRREVKTGNVENFLWLITPSPDFDSRKFLLIATKDGLEAYLIQNGQKRLESGSFKDRQTFWQ